jgi:hypothetical protein
MPAPNPTEAPPGNLRIGKLKATHEGFGRVIDYLSRVEPFSQHSLGNFANSLRHQLRHGDHLAATSGRNLVGYMGWMPTSVAIAELWSEDKGPLRPVYDASYDAYALSVVAVPDRRILTPMIREALKEARARGPGKRLYFKREYQGRGPRKSSFDLPDGEGLGLLEVLVGLSSR